MQMQITISHITLSKLFLESSKYLSPWTDVSLRYSFNFFDCNSFCCSCNMPEKGQGTWKINRLQWMLGQKSAWAQNCVLYYSLDRHVRFHRRNNWSRLRRHSCPALRLRLLLLCRQEVSLRKEDGLLPHEVSILKCIVSGPHFTFREKPTQ